MDCRECAALVEHYDRVERLYASAINDLTQRETGAPVSEYQRLRRAADDARLEAETARLELEKHRREHRRRGQG